MHYTASHIRGHVRLEENGNTRAVITSSSARMLAILLLKAAEDADFSPLVFPTIAPPPAPPPLLRRKDDMPSPMFPGEG